LKAYRQGARVTHSGQHLVGLDLDGVKQVGEPLTLDTPFDRRDDERDFIDTYTEISPSDTGLRAFAFANLPPQGRKKGNFECY
jgi:hypothetical protein